MSSKARLTYAKVLLLLGIVVVTAAFFLAGLHKYLSLTSLHSSREAFQAYYATYPLTALVVYMATYVLLTALSLPGAVVMTLAGGALSSRRASVPVVASCTFANGLPGYPAAM